MKENQEIIDIKENKDNSKEKKNAKKKIIKKRKINHVMEFWLMEYLMKQQKMN